MQSARISGGDAFFETSTLVDGRTDTNARISVYIAASYDAARNARMPEKWKQKKGRRIQACEIEKESGRGREREKGERKEEMDLAECIIAALKALRTRVSRERLLCVQLKHERVSLCNKRARAARTICVTYAHNAVITNDERNKGERKGRSEKGRSHHNA